MAAISPKVTSTETSTILSPSVSRLGPGSEPRWGLTSAWHWDPSRSAPHVALPLAPPLGPVFWRRLVAGAPCDRVTKTTNKWLAFSKFLFV